jgi:hypothetical protein
MRKIIVEAGSGHRWQYGACALKAGYLRLQIHTQNMQYLLLFHCNNSCTKAPGCYVIRALPVLIQNLLFKIFYAFLYTNPLTGFGLLYCQYQISSKSTSDLEVEFEDGWNAPYTAGFKTSRKTNEIWRWIWTAQNQVSPPSQRKREFSLENVTFCQPVRILALSPSTAYV